MICETSAKMLPALTPAQRAAAGNALVVERREGFQNTISMAMINFFERYETAAKLPELMEAK